MISTQLQSWISRIIIVLIYMECRCLFMKPGCVAFALLRKMLIQAIKMAHGNVQVSVYTIRIRFRRFLFLSKLRYSHTVCWFCDFLTLCDVFSHDVHFGTFLENRNVLYSSLVLEGCNWEFISTGNACKDQSRFQKLSLILVIYLFSY